MPTKDELSLAFAEFLSTVPVARLKQNLIKIFLEYLKDWNPDNDFVFTEHFLSDYGSLLDFLYRIEEVIEWNNS